MREIKFRAWRFREKAMEQVCPTPSGVGHYDEISQCVHEYVNGIFSDPMQFTGLKDQHGKDIYEGDIISFGERGDNSIVAWSDQDAQFQVNGYGFESDLCYVIGNIHETPELLEPAK